MKDLLSKQILQSNYQIQSLRYNLRVFRFIIAIFSDLLENSTEEISPETREYQEECAFRQITMLTAQLLTTNKFFPPSFIGKDMPNVPVPTVI